LSDNRISSNRNASSATVASSHVSQHDESQFGGRRVIEHVIILENPDITIPDLDGQIDCSEVDPADNLKTETHVVDTPVESKLNVKQKNEVRNLNFWSSNSTTLRLKCPVCEQHEKLSLKPEKDPKTSLEPLIHKPECHYWGFEVENEVKKDGVETGIEKESEAKCESEIEKKSEAKSETGIKEESEAKLESGIVKVCEAESETEIDKKLEAKSETGIDKESEAKSETEINIESAAKSETGIEKDSEAKSETGNEKELEAKSESGIEKNWKVVSETEIEKSLKPETEIQESVLENGTNKRYTNGSEIVKGSNPECVVTTEAFDVERVTQVIEKSDVCLETGDGIEVEKEFSDDLCFLLKIIEIGEKHLE